MSSISSLGSYSQYSSYMNSSSRMQKSSSEDIEAKKEERFSQIDTDGDESISSSEFEEMFNKMAENRPELPEGVEVETPSASDMFSEFDTDGDGAISKDEFSAGEDKMHQAGGMPPPPPPGGGMGGGSSEDDSTSTQDLLAQLLGSDSESEDGSVTMTASQVKQLFSMLIGQSAYSSQALTSSSFFQ